MSNSKANEQLFDAIIGENLDQVAAALDAGADTEAQLGYPSATPLGHAALHGHAEIAALLLDRGAQVDGTNVSDQTALHAASEEGHMDVAELLVSHGASLDVADGDGFTPLLASLIGGKHEMATWLLDRGARLDGITSRGETGLHLAVRAAYPDLARLLQDATVAAMVDAGDTWNDRTALHYAARRGQLDHVRLLLDAGASVHATDSAQSTPLHWACGGDHVEVMRELLQRGVRVDAVDKDEQTALMCVVESADSNSHPAVRLLLEFGADRSLRNDEGRTARDVAVEDGEDELVEVLDTYFPLTVQMEQVLLGLRGPSESPLTRFAQHSAFEPKVLSIVAAFHSGKSTPAFEQLQREAADQGRGDGVEASSSSSCSSSTSSSSSHTSKKARLS